MAFHVGVMCVRVCKSPYTHVFDGIGPLAPLTWMLLECRSVSEYGTLMLRVIRLLRLMRIARTLDTGGTRFKNSFLPKVAPGTRSPKLSPETCSGKSFQEACPGIPFPRSPILELVPGTRFPELIPLETRSQKLVPGTRSLGA